MDWLAILLMTAGHTFWFFLLAGDIPGTVEHEHWKRKRENSACNQDETGSY